MSIAPAAAPSQRIDDIAQHSETKRETGNKLQSQMEGKNRLHQAPTSSGPVAHQQNAKTTRNLVDCR
jgi:hypothetical protein